MMTELHGPASATYARPPPAPHAESYLMGSPASWPARSVAMLNLLSVKCHTSVMRGRGLGRARFICPQCGHGVAATWRKRTKMYEGRCIHCERWNKYLRPKTLAVPVLD